MYRREVLSRYVAVGTLLDSVAHGVREQRIAVYETTSGLQPGSVATTAILALEARLRPIFTNMERYTVASIGTGTIVPVAAGGEKFQPVYIEDAGYSPSINARVVR